MKEKIQQLLSQAIQLLVQTGQVPSEVLSVAIVVERCRDRTHGDWTSSWAMMAARNARRSPRDLAQLVVQSLAAEAAITHSQIAGPGFINFRTDKSLQHQALLQLLNNPAYGHSTIGANQHIQVEFVSANPTSALHVGHGRGAAYGMSVASLLASQGFTVQREYYVNDAGRQMHILATSTYLRYLECCGETLVFPVNGYRGDYVREIAAEVFRTHGTVHQQPLSALYAGVAADEHPDTETTRSGGDKEAHIDGLIAAAQRLLGETAYAVFFQAALSHILQDIRQDLEEFGVHYDRWYSERSLMDQGALQRAISRLNQAGATYEQNNALWFRSTAYGDDKDRVLIRDNGQSTYFASDVAYHLDKFERGFDRIINIWGADHHGYIPRVKAALQALGIDPERLEVRLVQFVTLWRGHEQVQMSSRSGQFITLRQLRQEVGNDAARFYYITRKSEQHIDFDMALATSQSKDNPVYYIQYAHARICSIELRFQEEIGELVTTQADMLALEGDQEQDIIRLLSSYPDTLATAAKEREPHQLAFLLRDLAALFHTWYNQTKVIVDERPVAHARMLLCGCIRQVLRQGLTLLGVQAPVRM